MSENQILGACPNCGRELLPGTKLIEWDEEDGVGIFADCWNCDEIVRPVPE